MPLTHLRVAQLPVRQSRYDDATALARTLIDAILSEDAWAWGPLPCPSSLPNATAARSPSTTEAGRNRGLPTTTP